MKAKVMTVLMLLISGLAFGQTNTFYLRVADGTPGKVNDQEVDVAGYTASDKILVEIVVDSLDFVLAGFEFRLDFINPTLSMEDTDAAFQDGDAPFKAGSAWGAAPLVLLPSDSSSNQTAATVNNSFGTFRCGALVTDPVQRPSGDGTSEYVLATVEICLTDPAGTCRTLGSQISAFLCAQNGPECDIHANDSATRVAMNYSDATRIINVTDSSVTKYKGDVNNDAALTTADVLHAIGCVNGFACNIDVATDLQQGDVNCSGAFTTGDIIPLINLTNQVTGRSAGKKSVKMDQVAGEGSFVIDNSGLKGAGFEYEIKVDGPVTFQSVSAPDNGWYFSAKYHADYGVYKVIAAYLPGGDVEFPSLEIDYKAGKGASMGVIHSAYYNANAKEISDRGAVSNTGAVSSRDRLDDDRVKN